MYCKYCGGSVDAATMQCRNCGREFQTTGGNSFWDLAQAEKPIVLPNERESDDMRSKDLKTAVDVLAKDVQSVKKRVSDSRQRILPLLSLISIAVSLATVVILLAAVLSFNGKLKKMDQALRELVPIQEQESETELETETAEASEKGTENDDMSDSATDEQKMDAVDMSVIDIRYFNPGEDCVISVSVTSVEDKAVDYVWKKYDTAPDETIIIPPYSQDYQQERSQDGVTLTVKEPSQSCYLICEITSGDVTQAYTYHLVPISDEQVPDEENLEEPVASALNDEEG